MILRPSASALVTAGLALFDTLSSSPISFHQNVHALSVSISHKVKARSGTGVYAVYEVIESVQKQAKTLQKSSDATLSASRSSIEAAASTAVSDGDKLILEEALDESKQTKSAYDAAYAALIRFSNTVSQALGAEPQSSTCDEIKCGENAVCDANTAKCVCQEGFIGDGILCSAPDIFLPEKVFGDEKSTKKVTEVDAVTFQLNSDGSKKIAMVYRDESFNDRGYVIFGDVSAAKVKFDASKILLISGETQAFGLRVIALPADEGSSSTKLAVTYRDAKENGNGYMTVVSAGESTDKDLYPAVIARNLNAPLAQVALKAGSVVVFYPSEALDTEGKVSSQFGEAAVVKVDGNKAEAQGRFRFYEKLVADVNVVNIGHEKFVLGFRGSRFAQPLDTDKKPSGEEAALVLGHQKGMELVFDPELLSVKSSGQQLVNHDLSLVSQNEVALSYYNQADMRAEVSLVSIDVKGKAGKKLTQVEGYPKLVMPAPADMTAVFLNQRNTLSMPFVGSKDGSNVPRTFHFYEKKPIVPAVGAAPKQELFGRVCALPKEGNGAAPLCTESSVGSGVNVGPLNALTGYADGFNGVMTAVPLGFPGRIAFAYTGDDGSAYFQILSV